MATTYEVEYTDTFGGEANYAWVRRATIEAPDGMSRRSLMRQAKAAVGITGLRGSAYDSGEMIEWRPRGGICTVMFIHARY